MQQCLSVGKAWKLVYWVILLEVKGFPPRCSVRKCPVILYNADLRLFIASSNLSFLLTGSITLVVRARMLQGPSGAPVYVLQRSTQIQHFNWIQPTWLLFRDHLNSREAVEKCYNQHTESAMQQQCNVNVNGMYIRLPSISVCMF